MPKNLFEDMVKVKRAKQRESVPSVTKVNLQEQREPMEPRFINENYDKKRPKYKLWLVAIVSFIFFLFALSYFFGRATFTINPKVQDAVLNENLSASKDGSGNALSFNLVVISGDASEAVLSTTQKDVAKAAEGTIILYNAFSTAPQPLSIDTRLEGSNGKMYKTKTKTTIPGMNKDGTPGSVSVGIYADVAGVASNSGPLDFKIFGFKGTSKYAKFYGRSSGDIIGGITGKFPFITDNQKTAAVTELTATLQAKLLAQATNQVPSGFILFKDATFLNTDGGNIDFNSAQNTTVPVDLKGTLYGLLLNEKQLTQKIAQDNVDKYDGSDVYIPHIQDLTFSLSNKDNISFADVTNINFSLSGPAKIVSKVDTDKLVSDLLGKSKKDFNQTLTQYPSINSATLSISPIWKFSIPDKAKDIKVIVNYPQ